MKVLYIQTAYLGDTALSIPALRALAVSGASVTALVSPQGEEILRLQRDVETVISYDKKGRERGLFSFLHLIRLLRKLRFDAAVVPHRSLRSALLPYLAGIPTRIGFDRSACRFLFTDVISYSGGSHEHEVERNLRLVQRLEAKDWDGEWNLRVGETLFSRSLGVRRWIGIAPGSTWPTKRWPAERYAKLTDALFQEGFEVALLGASTDLPVVEEILSIAKHKPRNFAGRTDISELLSILQKVEMLVCGDTAPAHLATAIGTPVISIFGPTVTEFGFFPYSGRVVETPLYCRPCSWHGGKVCPEGHFLCMGLVSVGDILDEIHRKLTDDPTTAFGVRCGSLRQASFAKSSG